MEVSAKKHDDCVEFWFWDEEYKAVAKPVLLLEYEKNHEGSVKPPTLILTIGEAKALQAVLSGIFPDGKITISEKSDIKMDQLFHHGQIRHE